MQDLFASTFRLWKTGILQEILMKWSHDYTNKQARIRTRDWFWVVLWAKKYVRPVFLAQVRFFNAGISNVGERPIHNI